MLSREENERLTTVAGEAPMGAMMRRYWLPACMSEEVSEPDGTPVRLRILGEPLVAFRDTAGRLALVDERCPHRLASLALGRNEDGGLRCVYHGWKFDVAGTCIDMPTEPGSFGFRDRMNIRSYPVREAGGLVWTYMGPEGTEPQFPAYDWMSMPGELRAIIKVCERTNYLQAMEGAIDSSHSWFLHSGTIFDWQKRSSISTDLSPKLEAEDTPYGFRYAAIRKPTVNPETERYIRVTQYILPFTALIPRSLDRDEAGHVQFFVPIDDTHTTFFGIFFSQKNEPIDEAETRERYRVIKGRDLDRNYYRLARVENWFNQDREAMKDGSWIGIDGFTNQDMACQESMGPIVDRTQEHLGTSDIAIIRMRRRMLEALRRFEAGEPLLGQDAVIPYDRLRGEQKILPVGAPWQSVGAYADNLTAASSARD